MDILNSSVWTFVLYVITPGIIVVTIHDQMAPSEKRNWQDMILALMSYAAFNFLLFALLAPLLQWLPTITISTLIYPTRLNVIQLVILDIVIPAFIAWLSVALPRWQLLRQFSRGIFLDPEVSSWDFVFSKRKSSIILFHMKSGENICGFYGIHSYTSTFPQPQDIYVQELCKYNEQTREFARVERSAGALIPMSECSYYEFVELPTPSSPVSPLRRQQWQKISHSKKVEPLKRLLAPIPPLSAKVDGVPLANQTPAAFSLSDTTAPPSPQVPLQIPVTEDKQEQQQQVLNQQPSNLTNQPTQDQTPNNA